MIDSEGNPISIVASIDITDKCNLRCRHCFNSSGTREIDSELTKDELLRVAKEILELDPLVICFCGGEPLLRKEVVYDVASFIKNNSSCSLNMVSNGLLIDDEVSRRLKEIGFNYVQISVDGFRENHDWMRNKIGAFDSAMNAIRCLKNSGMNVGVACTPTIKNIGEVPELIEELDSMGVNSFRMQPIMPLGRAVGITDFFPSDTDYIKLSRKLDSLSASRKYKMGIEWGDPTQHISTMSEGFWNKGININAYGDIMVSPYIPVSIGNVRNHPIKEYFNSGMMNIHNNSSFKRLFELMLNNGTLDVSSVSNLPKLYSSTLFKIDIIDDDLDEKNRELAKIIGGSA